MKLLAPNLLVDGSMMFELNAPTGTPNPPTAAAKYESDIEGLVRKIKGQSFGTRWLDIVGNNVEPIIVVPTTATNNAEAQTFPNIPQRPNRMADASSGRGTPIRVKFNPNANLGWISGGVSGETLLLHEVTHGYRSASGRFSPLPMTDLVSKDSLQSNSEVAKRFPNWEEWLAVVVENVFASEQGKSILRTSWDQLLPAFATDPKYFKFWDIPTTGTRNDCQQFAHDYYPAITRMLQLESRLFHAIEASHGWFNPVRDYVDELPSSRT